MLCITASPLFWNSIGIKGLTSLLAYGIQQMFDTVTCRRNITIPFLRIVDELIQDTKEPVLKEYIQERYRKPWIKRMNELPLD